MKLRNYLLIIFVSTATFQICFGQNTAEIVEGENWVQQYGIYQSPIMVFRYDRYSKEDTVKFREKLDLMKDAKFSDEWEGNYFSDLDQLGISSFRWDSNIGFVDFYIYTCFPELRYLSYGKVTNASEFIQIMPEFAENSPRKSEPVKYVKVKWSDRHYLVEESSLSAFAEKSVGIYVETAETPDEGFQKWSSYWVNGDTEKELTGLPEFPPSYKKFQRLPIETKIIAVGKRTIESEKQFGDKSYMRHFQDNAVYPITIGAGKNKGVKAGMYFCIFETGEEVFITEVNQNTAIGFVARDTDENKNDVCYNDDNTNESPCPKLKSSFKVKTRIGHLWF